MRPVYPQAANNDGKLWLEYGVRCFRPGRKAFRYHAQLMREREPANPLGAPQKQSVAVR
jgi:hypothetical protein